VVHTVDPLDLRADRADPLQIVRGEDAAVGRERTTTVSSLPNRRRT
jgi:hypothetical protein